MYYKVAIEFYGEDVQLTVAIEELSELIKELCKYKRDISRIDNIAEEMADVKVMLNQLEIIFKNKNKVAGFYNEKLRRLSDRIKIEKQFI